MCKTHSCPQCGANDIEFSWGSPDDHGFHIEYSYRCKQCGRYVNACSKDEALARWNRLKPEERIRQLEEFIRSRSCGKCKGKNTPGVCADCVVYEILNKQS